MPIRHSYVRGIFQAACCIGSHIRRHRINDYATNRQIHRIGKVVGALCCRVHPVAPPLWVVQAHAQVVTLAGFGSVTVAPFAVTPLRLVTVTV